jgi:uncharacterized protein (DUF1697 family)
MALVQTEAQFVAMANSVGFPDERAEDIHALAVAANPANVDDLAAILNEQGYYDEQAQHLVDAGVTFA